MRQTIPYFTSTELQEIQVLIQQADADPIKAVMRWLAKIHDNFDVSVPSIAHSDEYITDILEFLNTGTDKLPFVMLLTIAAANYESSESKGARELRRFGDELKRRATEYALIMKGGGVKGLAY
ncbi:MAG TPA: hypothetical protein PL105_04015, partial [Caldilineaceae bacterium]|nr:hypothetical protein [Caldilineaceae bacterium]